MIIIYYFSTNLFILCSDIFFSDVYTMVKNEDVPAYKVHIVCSTSAFRKQQSHDSVFGLTDAKVWSFVFLKKLAKIINIMY